VLVRNSYACLLCDKTESAPLLLLRALMSCRPVLSFDAAFDSQPHTQLLKEQLAQVRELQLLLLLLLRNAGCRMPVCFTQVEEQRSALPALLCLTACTKVYTTGTPALPPVCVNLLCYTAVISACRCLARRAGTTV
jgi:hypothetical protein